MGGERSFPGRLEWVLIGTLGLMALNRPTPEAPKYTPNPTEVPTPTVRPTVTQTPVLGVSKRLYSQENYR